jgi:large subunit ribosomal protein L10
MKLENKKTVVEEVAVIAAAAKSAVAAHYRGLTVGEITELRVKARQADVYMRIVRNTLARRAVKETPFACLQEVLVGPMLLLFSQQDPGAAARLVRDYARDHEKLEVRALAIGGRLLEAKQLAEVADLPTLEQALGMLAGVMIAPVTKLVRTLAEPYAMLTRTVAAVRDKKQVS